MTAGSPSLAVFSAALAAAAGWLSISGPTPREGMARIAKPASKTAEASWQSRVDRWKPRPAGRLRIATAAGGAIVAAWYAFLPALVISVATYVLLRRWRRRRQVSADQRQRARDVATLRALAAELRSGLAPGLALQAAGRSAGAARGIARRMLAAAAADALGGDPAEVFKADAEPGSPAAAVGAAWAVCQQTGARLAAPVARIAQGAAADLRIARETDAALAGARSSAHLLAALPIAGVVLGAISGTNSVHVLLSTSVGQLCLLLGIALDLAGLAWLDRLAAAGSA